MSQFAQWLVVPARSDLINRPIVGRPPRLPREYRLIRSKRSVYLPFSEISSEDLKPQGSLETVPAAISDLALGTVTYTTVPLTWSAPSDGGSTITDYEVRYTVGGVPHATVLTGSTSTSFTIGGGGGTPASEALGAGVAITAIDVRAVNSVGTAASSNVLTTTTDTVRALAAFKNGLAERDLFIWDGATTVTRITNQDLMPGGNGLNKQLYCYAVNGTKVYLVMKANTASFVIELTNYASPVVKYTFPANATQFLVGTPTGTSSYVLGNIEIVRIDGTGTAAKVTTPSVITTFYSDCYSNGTSAYVAVGKAGGSDILKVDGLTSAAMTGFTPTGSTKLVMASDAYLYAADDTASMLYQSDGTSAFSLVGSQTSDLFVTGNRCWYVGATGIVSYVEGGNTPVATTTADGEPTLTSVLQMGIYYVIAKSGTTDFIYVYNDSTMMTNTVTGLIGGITSIQIQTLSSTVFIAVINSTHVYRVDVGVSFVASLLSAALSSGEYYPLQLEDKATVTDVSNLYYAGTTGSLTGVGAGNYSTSFLTRRNSVTVQPQFTSSHSINCETTTDVYNMYAASDNSVTASAAYTTNSEMNLLFQHPNGTP